MLGKFHSPNYFCELFYLFSFLFFFLCCQSANRTQCPQASKKKKKKDQSFKKLYKKKKREKFISKFIYVKEKSVERKFWIFQICRFEIYEIFKQIHRHIEILHEKKKKKKKKKEKREKKKYTKRNLTRQVSLSHLLPKKILACYISIVLAISFFLSYAHLSIYLSRIYYIIIIPFIVSLCICLQKKKKYEKKKK